MDTVLIVENTENWNSEDQFTKKNVFSWIESGLQSVYQKEKVGIQSSTLQASITGILWRWARIKRMW